MSEEQLIKLLEKPLPISVNELCTEGFDFIIPSYQRGYRWTRKEVIRLILDVLSYNQDKDGKFYCLQPLVVRHKEVNGQQIDARLCKSAAEGLSAGGFRQLSEEPRH